MTDRPDAYGGELWREARAMLADALRDRLPATAEAFDEETVALTDAETAAVDALAAVLAAAEAKPPQ